MRCPNCGAHVSLPRRPLTKRQAALYRFVVASLVTHGFAPSYREIADYFGYGSLATVHEHLSNIEDKGFIARVYGEARSIMPLVLLDEMGGVPS